MRRKRRPYPAEFREQMIELVGAGRTPEELWHRLAPTMRDALRSKCDTGSSSFRRSSEREDETRQKARRATAQGIGVAE